MAFDPASYAANAGADLLNTGVQMLYNNRQSDKQYKRQKAMIREERDYNKPINQVRRLREAGLNPNLLAPGSGSVSGNQNSTADPPEGDRLNRNVIRDPLSSALDQGQLVRLKAETDNVNARTENERIQGQLHSLRALLDTEDLLKKRRENSPSITQLWEDLQRQSLYNMRSKGQLQDDEHDMNQFKREGMQLANKQMQQDLRQSILNMNVTKATVSKITEEIEQLRDRNKWNNQDRSLEVELKALNISYLSGKINETKYKTDLLKLEKKYHGTSYQGVFSPVFQATHRAFIDMGF